MDNPERQNDKQHKTVREGVMTNRQSRETERQTTQTSQRRGNEEWTIQRERTTNNTKPVREGIIKNGQSRETERQTTQNQLEKGQ